jgi:Na+-translocating ferredoxin:NAD+ oxidoreductase RnfG subunit
MNKMIKLPLFLGVCGAACAVILAGLYQVTQPIIEKTKAENAAMAYLSMYEELGVTKSDIQVVDSVDLSDDLYNIGCTGKAIIEKDSVKGVAYTCSFKGYGGQVDFQIGFAKGKYHAFTALKHGETAQGKTAMEKLPDLVPTLSIGSDLTDLSVVTASSFTGMPIAKIVEVCKADYLAWYNA